MEYSKKLETQLKKQVRGKVKSDLQINKEIDGFCQQYHCWMEEQLEENKKPITIIAEGDSWFRYIIGKAVIFQLEKSLKTNILNLSSPGDEVSEMISIRQKQRLIRELKKGPCKRRKFDFLLFSGGGNDLVGVDRFYKWLKPYKKGLNAAQLINKASLKLVFNMLSLGYQEIIDVRDQYSPNTQLLIHSYDFAIPDGRGVCGIGPWLKPGLEVRKIPVHMRKEVVKLFLLEFNKLLKSVAGKNNKVTLIATQGTLSENEWANELHPKNKGFKKIAERFAETIKHLSEKSQ